MYIIFVTNYFNPIRFGMFETPEAPGWGGALNVNPPPPPLRSQNLCCQSKFCLCILPGILHMFQANVFKNIAIMTILQ